MKGKQIMIDVFNYYPTGKRKPTKKEKKRLKKIQEIVNQSERDFQEKRFVQHLMEQDNWVITPLSIVQVECDNLPHRFNFDIVDIKGVFVEDLRQTFKTSDCYLFFNQWLEFFNQKHSPEQIKKVLKEKFNYEDEE